MPHWRDAFHRGSTIDQDLVWEDECLVIHSKQDVSRILDDNSRLRSQGQRPGTKGTFAARVPDILYWVEWPEEFRKKHGWHPRRPPSTIKAHEASKMYRDFFVAKLHERDFSKLRIDDKRFTADG